MSTYLLLGGDNAAKEIADTLLSHNKKIIVVDPNFPDDKIININLDIIKKELTDISLNENKNIFQDVSIIIILAGKRIAENIDESMSILLGDRRFIDDIDAKTLLKVLEVRRTFKTLYPDNSIRIIAEMIEEKNKELFLDAKVDEIIPTDLLVEKIMVQAVFNEGLVSELVIKLLTRNDKAHLTSVTVSKDSEYKDLIGKTYDGLLSPLLEMGMQLIAIDKSNHKEGNDTIATKNGESIIINPVKSSDKDYSLHDKDRLIVLRATS